MITVNGAIDGAVTSIRFEPSQPVFRDSDNNVFLAAAIPALIQELNGIKQMSVQLPDNTELVGKQGWRYLVYENRGKVLTMFAISADPAELRYARIRPVRG